MSANNGFFSEPDINNFKVSFSSAEQLTFSVDETLDTFSDSRLFSRVAQGYWSPDSPRSVKLDINLARIAEKDEIRKLNQELS